jgi:hypothetical protein
MGLFIEKMYSIFSGTNLKELFFKMSKPYLQCVLQVDRKKIKKALFTNRFDSFWMLITFSKYGKIFRREN